MKNILLGAVASIALALGAAPALAQDAPAVVHVWGTLEENLAADLDEYGSRVEVVTEEQIRNGGFSDASQALQMLVPGLYLAPKNGAFDYVSASLLGGRRQDIIWLVDGVRISNRLYTTTTPLDTMPAEMIERIEVLKGGQSLFYGTSAVSGAINIITRGFTEEQKSQITIGAASFEGRHIAASTSGTNGEHHFVLFASHDEAEGFQPFRDQDYQPSATDRNRGYDVTNIGGKYGYAFSDALKLSVDYLHTDATLDFANAYETNISTNVRDEDILSAKVDWAAGDNFNLYAKAYYHWWDTRFTDLRNPEVYPVGIPSPAPGSLLVINDKAFWGFEDYGLNLMGESKLNDVMSVVYGFDYQNYSGQDDVFLIAKQTEDVFAPFVQARWNLDFMQGLKIAAGARANFPSGEGKTNVWNLSGDLAITDYFYARGQIGTSFRLPDASELFTIDPCCEQGNPNLEGEESFNTEIGFGGHGDNVSWEITGFHRELDNLIQIVSIPDTRPVTGPRPGHLDPADCAFATTVGCYDFYTNEGRGVETNGAEFTLNWRFSDQLAASFDWTHTEAQLDGSDAQLSNIPVDSAKVGMDWTPSNMPITAGFSAVWMGELFANAPSSLGSVELGDYLVVDLNARYYLDADHKQHLSLRVENLFDETYFSAPGRGFIDGTGDPSNFDNGTPYLANSLGTPQSIHLSYTIDF